LLAEQAIRHNFLEYAELFFFLLLAMIYINAMLACGVSHALRDVHVSRGLSYKSLFWLTAVLAFFISPVADNLTIAVVMSAVIMGVGNDQPKFIGLACINFAVLLGKPVTQTNAPIFKIKQGGLVIVGLCLATIVTAISFHLWRDFSRRWFRVYAFLGAYFYLISLRCNFLA
jgi:hypothetical protein